MSLYDLIVVGSGPAGSSAARAAAKEGLKTLLVEKDRLPRNKLCGGGVTPKVLKLFDFKLPDDLIDYSARSVRIHTGYDTYHFEADHPLVYMTARTKFDAFLAEKAVEAGVDLSDENPAREIEVTNSYVELKTKKGMFRSRMLIGADGIGGPTAREAKLYDYWSPDQVAYAIESEVYVGEEDAQSFGGPECYFDLYFGVSPAGYGWVFPKDDHLTVGVGCKLDRLRDAQTLFYGFLKRIPELADAEIPKPSAHLIPLGGSANVPRERNRILLAGDSAGFAEPLLGEGIYFSILGGQIAANTATEACETNRFDSDYLGRYGSSCREAFLKDFEIAYRVARTSYLEQYDMDRVTRFFLSERRVQECMMGLMDGSLTYRDAQMKLAWPYVKYRLGKLGLPFYS